MISFERLLVVEDELVEAYVRGELPPPERERFRRARSRNAPGAGEGRVCPHASRLDPRSSTRGRLTPDLLGRCGLRLVSLQRWPLPAAAAAGLVAMVAAGWWLAVENRGLRLEIERATAERTAMVEREARLSAIWRASKPVPTSLAEDLQRRAQAQASGAIEERAWHFRDVVSLVLFPGLVRDTEALPRLPVSGSSIIVLTLAARGGRAVRRLPGHGGGARWPSGLAPGSPGRSRPGARVP